MKNLHILLLVFLIGFAFSAKAQLSNPIVDAGPYTPNSTIAATFQIDPTTCIAQNNTFNLYLSDASGSFIGEKLIGSYTGFYSTFVNGIIPAGTAPGTGYMVRVKTSNGVLVSAASNPFEIKAGTAVVAKLTSSAIDVAHPETFGLCTGKDNNSFIFTNESTATSTVNATFTNELTGATSSIFFDIKNKTFIARLAHYTIFTKAVMPDGTVATKAYFLINNQSITAFATTGNNTVCLPQGALSFIVDIASPNGIQNNFPGDVYVVSWGDGASNSYTLCDIKQNSGVVSHVYTKSSCGNVLSGSSGAEFNVFAVNISVQNSFCGRVGSTVSSTAKVVAKPINDFTFNTFACTNTNIIFNNTSTPGENPNTTTVGCTSNTVFYNWYVDGVLIEANKPKSYALNYVFTGNGNHVIRLESVSNGVCDAEPIEKTICVQNPPKPSFTLPSNLICAGSTIKPNNTSIVDLTCNNNNTSNWIVSPAAGVSYANGTTANSKDPEFIFNNPGVYQISLAIQTASCGTVTTATQTVVVNDAPTATLAADTELCNLSTYNFNTTSTLTKTTFTGTFKDEADTYTWVVTGGTSNFVSGTNANSKYPAIQFLEFKTYTITVTHKNNCGTVTKSQVIKFTAAPQVSADIDQTICYNTASVQLNGSASGSPTSVSWVGGSGTFTPGRNALNAVYEPTTAERNAGQVTLTLRAITNLPAPCNSIADEMIIFIKPALTLTSSNTASICTGNTFNYTPTSATAGTTFTWTAIGSANASGFTPSGSGNIADVLINASATTNATVTYTIIPTAGTCVGDPFTLTVTVTPKPILTATPTNATICTQQQTAITLSANLAATTYTWTSVATGGVTGNSTNSTPTASTLINDVLINNGTTSGTVTYTITPTSSNGCAGSAVTVTITVEPAPTTPNAGTNESICNASTYVLKGNPITVGTGKWTEVSGIGGTSFSDDTQNNATVIGLQPGKTYTFRWTATGAASCTPKISDVIITVNPISVGGTTAGATTVCAGNNAGTITLSGQVGSILNWESSTNGTTWTAINNNNTSINFANLTTTTQYRAVVQSGGCAPAFSTITIITVNQGAVVADAGTDQFLCNATSTLLGGNDPLTNIGAWTILSGPAGATFTDATKFNTTITGLIAGGTYILRWTITGLAPCAPTTDDVVITNYQPLLNNTITTPILTLCNGQIVTITGTTPTGGNNIYNYVWQSSPDGTTWQNINGQTSKDLSIAINTSLSYRRVVNSATCSNTSNVITVAALPPIANNVIATNQTICTTKTPNALTGTQPTGGDNVNYNYSWEQSINNGTTWTSIAAATSINYAPPALTQTTLFRRIVTSAACTGSQQSVSNVVTITVNPNAKAEFTYTTDVGCVPFALTAANIKAVAYPAQNATYTWYANGVIIGTGINFPGYTINTANQNVQIKLVAKSSFGCVDDEMIHTFSTRQDVNPSFTQSATIGCGPLSVNFTNTTPAAAGITYKWDFGNGVTSTLTNPGAIIFQADPLGDDKEYIVTLEAISPCGNSTTTAKVTVRPTPISAFSPNKTLGCSPFTVQFSNTSPGTNTTYVYDFGDGTTITKTDKTPVSHTYTTTLVQDFVVKMTATNECGTNESSYSIRVSPNNIIPELVVNSNQLTGCAPLTVDFFNNTKGATSYKYTFGDGGVITSNTLLPEKQTYTFTKAGTYTVELYATNGCSEATTTETITVLAQPLAAFTADKTVGCPNLSVKFTNKSIDAVSYQWDFGDGTTSNVIEPIHIYKTSGNFTVKLTAFNSQGCSYTETISNYINIVVPPKAAFAVSPAAIISIPSYTFKFTDESTNKPQSYVWDFGDGTNSTLKDPSHTYADTGRYLVKLKVISEQGCIDSTQKYVQITGVPGYLFVPNSFIPGSTSSPLQKFTAVGSGIKSWRMTILNKWGQVIWETTKLNDGKPEEGWDGTYKNVPQPQGIYFWKIEVELINGSEWKGMTYGSAAPKRTGEIYLIR